MQQSQDYRRIFFRMAEASQPQKRVRLKFRETLDTMILGTLSTSVGVVVLVIGLVGAVGVRRMEWHDLVEGTPVPAFSFGIASIVGEGLGLAGLALGRFRGGVISPLSAVGTLVCLCQMCLFFGQFLLLGLF
jgi:hypothetical protein